MLRSLTIASIAVLALGAAPAQASLIRFAADLSPANENPPVAGSTGTGWVTVDYDDVGHTLQVHAVWSGLSGNTTMAHIHCCAIPPTNAGVAVTPGTLPSFPAGVTSGDYLSPLLNLTAAGTFTAGFLGFAGGLGAAESVLIQNMRDGKAYFNIHSSIAAGGEIRGNLREVPEPGTLALLAASLLGLFGLRRRSPLRRASFSALAE